MSQHHSCLILLKRTTLLATHILYSLVMFDAKNTFSHLRRDLWYNCRIKTNAFPKVTGCVFGFLECFLRRREEIKECQTWGSEVKFSSLSPEQLFLSKNQDQSLNQALNWDRLVSWPM